MEYVKKHTKPHCPILLQAFANKNYYFWLQNEQQLEAKMNFIIFFLYKCVFVPEVEVELLRILLIAAQVHTIHT